VFSLYSQTNTLVTAPKISAEDYYNLLTKIQDQNIKSETIQVEVDKFGRVTSVESKQEKLKNLISNLIIGPYKNSNNELAAFTTILSVQKKKIKEFSLLNPQKDIIQTQLYNAVKLSTYMDEKNYDKALKLFSKKQQINIEKTKSKGEDLFNYWALAWTFNNEKLGRYTKRILSNRGNFILEENDWKIDEK
jgi:hypothetical protein